MTQGAIWVVLSRVGAGRTERSWGSPGLALAAGLAAGGVLLLLGCGGSPPAPRQTFAEFTPPASPSPTWTPSAPNVPAPVRPAEMGRSDEVGARAAATYFMELFSYSIHSGDLAEWDRISATDCGYCKSVRSEIQRVYGAGGGFTGGRLTTEPGDVLGRDPVLGGYGIGVGYEITGGAEVDSAGSAVAQKSAEQGYAIVDTAFSANGWILVGLSLEEGAP